MAVFLKTIFEAHGPVPENKARVWMHQIVSGVNYMHRKGVAHRDLKLENLILCKGRVKIGDFGFCTNVRMTEKALQMTYNSAKRNISLCYFYFSQPLWHDSAYLLEYIGFTFKV